MECFSYNKLSVIVININSEWYLLFMSESKRMIDELMENPRIAAVIMFIANGSNWVSSNFDLIITRATAISSLVLIFVMIRYHIKNTRKIDRENKRDKKYSKSRSD